jgi:hypothetical protein
MVDPPNFTHPFADPEEQERLREMMRNPVSKRPKVDMEKLKEQLIAELTMPAFEPEDVASGTRSGQNKGYRPKQFILQMDGSHNGGNPPSISENEIEHRNGTARILFSMFSDTHDVASIMMTRIAVQDYDCRELLITVQDEEKFKALVGTIETKVKIVRRNRHRAVDDIERWRYAHDDGHGYKPLVFSHAELKGEINRMWRSVA